MPVNPMDERVFLIDIGVALILAKILGYYSERIRQPSVIGEILAGILIGRFFLGYFFDEIISMPELYPFNFTSEDFVDVAHLGIIFLLFIAGMETDIEQVRSTGKVAIFSTIGGVLVPLILGFTAGKLLAYSDKESLVIGVILTATSIGITARTMMDLGIMQSKVGIISMSSSIIDDIIGLILIVLVTGSGTIQGLALNIFVFFFAVAFGFRIIQRVMNLGERVRTVKAIVSIALGVCFLYSALAEYTISAAIEGAYFAGLMISTTVQSRRIIDDIKSIGYSVFIPLFFVYIGTIVNLGVFLEKDVIILSFVLLVVAIVGKVLGRGVGAVIAGFGKWESFQLGIGSIPRMEVALVSMTIAIRVGAIASDHADMFIAATVVFVTVTTLVTPPLIKWAFKEEIDASHLTPV
jgi:Kef-type K+ transport system membrane component KefB